MKLSFLIITLSISIIGCGTTRPIVSPRHVVSLRNSYIQLQKDINTILSDSLFIPSHVSVKVVALDDGKVLYERDSKVLMNPASNMKLFTSAAALYILDTNYQFKTSISVDALPDGGIVQGNIYLKGYGDPNLEYSHLDSLAKFIYQSGITRISGNLVVDDSYFDDNYWGSGWTWDDESDPDAPYINALSLNNNCIKINVISDSTSVSVTTEPLTGFVAVDNKAILVKDSIRLPLKIKRLFINNLNTFTIEGEQFPFECTTQKYSLRFPQYYAGTLMKEVFQRSGISVDGNIVAGIVPRSAQEIVQHLSPISSVVNNINKPSDNLSAENILKIIGITSNGVPGTAKNGITCIKRFLSTLKLDTTQFSIADGSGVSRYNLLSADQIVQLLIAIHNIPRIFPLFYESLPIAGIDGTLSERMSSYPAASNLRAKTGTLNGVSCLSGYVQTRDGEMLAFSMMMQNFVTPVFKYRKIQDKIGLLLSNFTRN